MHNKKNIGFSLVSFPLLITSGVFFLLLPLNFVDSFKMVSEAYEKQKIPMNILIVDGVFLFSLILYLIGIILLFIIYRHSEKKFASNQEYAGFWKRLAIGLTNWVLMYLILPPFINIYYYFRDGQTIGDKLFKTKIVEAPTGKIPSKLNLLGRFFLRGFSAALFYLGFLWVVFDKRNQAWHDKLSNTVVVEKTKVGSLWIWLANIFLPIIGIILHVISILTFIWGSFLIKTIF